MHSMNTMATYTAPRSYLETMQICNLDGGVDGLEYSPLGNAAR
jgi:hypothetical protein